jgi:spore germination protein YaaH
MSGQPYRYAKDVENFRNEYMDALNTISNINDMNLQANKNYKATGALPPQSSMKDNRTTAEIFPLL